MLKEHVLGMTHIIQKDKIIFLESLRGLAALTVVLFHFKIGSILNNGFTENGYLMVDFFFILSGFVIAYNYFDKINNIPTLKNYMFKRIFRLYPLHLFILLLWLAIEVTKYYLYINNSLHPFEDNIPFTKNNFQSFFMHLFLMQNVFTDQLTWNGPSWSISVEFYTYLIFGISIIVIGFLLREKTNLLYLMLCIFFVFSAVILLLFATEKMFLRCIYGFFLGSAMYFLSKYKNKYFCSNLLSYILALFAILCTIYIPKYQLLISFFYFLSIYSLLMLINFAPLVASTNFLLNILSYKPLVFLGSISYGVYMTHSLIIGGLFDAIKFSNLNFISKDGYITLVGFSQLEIELLMFSTLAIIISLSYLCLKYIERPFIDYSKKYNKFVD
jgi:peptidoglycan/LPS O-acetylase OafA/YrhL